MIEIDNIISMPRRQIVCAVCGYPVQPWIDNRWKHIGTADWQKIQDWPHDARPAHTGTSLRNLRPHNGQPPTDQAARTAICTICGESIKNQGLDFWMHI